MFNVSKTSQNKGQKSAILALFIALMLASCVNAENLLLARHIHGNVQNDLYVVQKDEKVIVPYSDSMKILTFGSADAELRIARGCAGVEQIKFDGLQKFVDLTCRYNKTSFVGCFRGEEVVADPFFVEGKEVLFASGLELSVEPTGYTNSAIATLYRNSFISNPDYCEPTNTIEALAEQYAIDTLERNYNAYFEYFAPDIRVKANAYDTVYEGFAVAYAYHLIADPDTSDAMIQLTSEKVSVVSEGNVVMANWIVTVRSLHLDEGPDPENPLNVYTDNMIREFVFDEYGRIVSLDVYINTALVFAYFPQTTAPVIPETCATIQEFCVGPHQQYPSEQACVDFMESIALINGPFAQSVGSNSAACRAFHTVLARAIPEYHCKHTGPYWEGNIIDTPCNDATSVWNPFPASKRTSNDIRSTHTMSVCDDSPYCNYRVVSHSDRVSLEQINFENFMIKLLPAAGQKISEYLATQA